LKFFFSTIKQEYFERWIESNFDDLITENVDTYFQLTREQKHRLVSRLQQEMCLPRLIERITEIKKYEEIDAEPKYVETKQTDNKVLDLHMLQFNKLMNNDNEDG
jgi:hypothetical protein